MCTVTFIPVRDSYLITSNRDEKNSREAALAPAFYRSNGWSMIYPKDASAEGTWIALKENGDAAVLLNGAFISHVSRPPYRKSRGLLFLDVFSADHPAWAFSKIDLHGIEPFTLVLFENNSLYEFRWDGIEKYCKQLSGIRPHIWSSATLYTGAVIKKREQWFARFLNRTPDPTQQDILNFHRFGGEGDKENDLLMERNGIYSTASITSILLNADRGVMKYYDLKNNKTSEIKVVLANREELV
jgi:transport and Golgi organization protein 2